MQELFAWLEASAQAMLADPMGRLAFVAGGLATVLIVVSSVVRTIIPLRWLAVAANMGFIVYGVAQPAPMVALLHAALLPINLWRVLEMMRLTRRVRAAVADGAADAHVWLQPYMKRKRLRAGTVLFRKGDAADRLYVLAEGALDLVEHGRRIEAGEMFGEIAFFAPSRQRTGTVRAAVDSTVLSIDETAFKHLFYQNPGFGLEIVRLIAARLSGDVQRLERRQQEHAAAGSAP